ncbi:uncharacterized protein B0H18DRAFT_1039618 [Fomitopsis serialis]|uniref:uncharacterized protein n=1 Tax=Fomitopsis serialis TaxID=139415 RepID=UPI0020082205|nr:uncharacterized protein B0H18DRAFT_1039618 [Neoantrodia serialis]KAH9915896.1 hypothetical protein B0H18DRAFT_1039618 [Neoantrodia serialis]
MLRALHPDFMLPLVGHSGREMVVHAKSRLKSLRDELQAERGRAAGEGDDEAVNALQARVEQLVQEKEQILKEKQHITAHLRGANTELENEVAEIREATRVRDEEIKKKTETITTLQGRLSEKDDELRSCEEIVKENQDTVACLTDANSRLESEVEELREALLAQDDQKRRILASLKAKLQKKEEEVRACEESKKSIETERDQARAVKGKAISALKARTEALKTLTNERDELKSMSEKYKADVEKAEQLAWYYGWAGQFDKFLKFMQALPEPTDVLPTGDKIRPCITTVHIGATPRVSEIYSESDAVLYLPDLPLWAPNSGNGIAVVHVYEYNANEETPKSRWTLNNMGNDLHEQVRELFYRDEDGSVRYAGTYKLHRGPVLMGVPDLANLNMKPNAAKMLARRTLAPSDQSQSVFKATEGAYAMGLLPVGLIGLQCLGYKTGFDDRLREYPKPVVNRDLSAKRKVETGTIVDPRKRVKAVADQAATTAPKSVVRTAPKTAARRVAKAKSRAKAVRFVIKCE